MNQHIDNKEIIEFYSDAIIEWCNELFVTKMPEVLRDPKEFRDFKRLITRLKEIKKYPEYYDRTCVKYVSSKDKK